MIGLRLILLLVGRTRDAEEFLAHRVRISDYRNELGLSGDSAYSHFRVVVRKLLTTIIQTENPVENSETEFQVLSRAKYWKGFGEVELMFHQDMRPLLLNLKAYFSKIPTTVFFRIQGLYAARFYLFCKSWDPQLNYAPGWRMMVEDLRKWLCLESDQYKEVKHIRAAILERAKEELDRVADVSFRYDPVHAGKRIVGWDFVPISNKPTERTLPGKRRAKKRDEKETAENGSALLEELDRIDSRWLAAGTSQRDEWLKAIPQAAQMFAPKPGARPSRLFLSALKAVLEPSLPGF